MFSVFPTCHQCLCCCRFQ